MNPGRLQFLQFDSAEELRITTVIDLFFELTFMASRFVAPSMRLLYNERVGCALTELTAPCSLVTGQEYF